MSHSENFVVGFIEYHQWRRSARCPALFAGVCEQFAYHTAELLFDLGCFDAVWAAFVSDSINIGSVKEPWSHIETRSSTHVVPELRNCFKKTVDRWWAVKDTSRQGYATGAVRPSPDESASECGVRISTVVEQGPVNYASVSIPLGYLPEPSKNLSLPRKENRNIAHSAMQLLRNFEIQSSCHATKSGL